MAKFGWDERRLFYVSETAFENLSSTPSDAETGQMLAYIKSDHLYIKKPTVAEVLIVEDGANVGTTPGGGSGANIFKQKNSSAQLEFRKIVSMDGRLDIVEASDRVELTIDFGDINNDLDHGLLLGLGDDDHTQYLLLAGRVGGQIAHGGTAASNSLELRSTSNATKGEIKIIDGSAFRHDSNVKQSYNLQTTDATPTAVATVSLTDNRVYQFKVMVVSRRSDATGKRGAWELQACAYREGAGAVLQGSVKQNFQNKNSSMDANLIVSGNNVVVQVTGIAAETHEWKAYVEYLESN